MDNRVLKEWETINKFLEEIDPKELGELVKEYYQESQHSSWEGYRRSDLTGIRRQYIDMMTYHRNK